jgi:hypothetical protein
VAEFCTGGAADCPPDAVAPEGTPCGSPTASECDGPDSCDGFGACDENLEPEGTPCGEEATECSDQDTCDGAGNCDPNDLEAGTPCGDGSDTDCTNPDSCDGAGTCDTNDEPDGTVCDDMDECTLDDACLTGECVGDELPSGVNVEVVLVGVNMPVTRCIQFVTDDCDEVFNAELDFVDDDGDPETGVRYVGPVDIRCGVWTSLCAKDQQHTLWATTTLTLSGPTYDADSVLYLSGGDTDDDGDVDIVDVTLVMAQFEELAADGGCPWDGTRDADFDNNGFVGSADYFLLTESWLAETECDCTTPMHAPGWPGPNGGSGRLWLERASSDLPAEVMAKVDMNADGIVDWSDVQRFEQTNGLPNTLSESMRRAGVQRSPFGLK